MRSRLEIAKDRVCEGMKGGIRILERISVGLTSPEYVGETQKRAIKNVNERNYSVHSRRSFGGFFRPHSFFLSSRCRGKVDRNSGRIKPKRFDRIVLRRSVQIGRPTILNSSRAIRCGARQLR